MARRRFIGSRSLVASAALVLLTALAGAPASHALPVAVTPLRLVVHEHSYPTDSGEASWLVVDAASGNPFENYLAASADGGLYNFGGSYLRFSSDDGHTWSEVRPMEPLISGEGAVVVAPNGDVLAVGWDPYTGDRVMAFKFTAAQKTWEYTETLLHTPFFDRPWLAVIPGPIQTPLGVAPYVAILRGGYPWKDVVYYAMDGLNYLYADLPAVSRSTLTQDLGSARAAYADWIQPQTQSTITPLPPIAGGLHALQNREGQLVLCSGWRALTPTNLQWGCVDAAAAELPPTGRMLVDSDGRLHHIAIEASVPMPTGFTYSISTDAGRTWNVADIDLPAEMSVESWDFKVAGGSLDMGVVTIHAHKLTGSDQDLLFKFGTANSAPVLQRLYYLGNGDKSFASGLNALREPRFDFASVAILPTGKVAVSFVDATHIAAAIAIEP